METARLSRVAPALVCALGLFQSCTGARRGTPTGALQAGATLAQNASGGPAASTPQGVRPPRAPPAMEHAVPAALTDETAQARLPANRREGTVREFPNPARATPFRTPEGLEGWKIALGGGRPLATPAVVDGTVYVGGGFGSHEFYAYDSVTGSPRWAMTVSDDGPTAAVVRDGRVAFNTESCTLFVVEARTGRALWSRWLGDPLMSQPTISEGQVFMAFPSPGGHRLVAFDVRDGTEQWRVPLNGDVISAPITHGDSVYAATFDGTIYRYRKTDGALGWRENYRATSAPWLHEGEVFVAHRVDAPATAPSAGRPFLGPLYFLHALFPQVESVGRLSTQSPTGTGGDRLDYRARPAPWLNPSVQRRSGYSAQQQQSDTSVGFANAPATARTAEAEANVGQGTVRGLWEYQGSRPMVLGGRMFLTQGDQLVALEPGTGRELWSRPLQGLLAEHGGHLASPPSAAGGRLFLATVTGDILVVSQTDGQVQSTLRLGHPMRFQPAVVGGRLYVGTADGQLIMLDLRDPTADGWTQWGGGPAHDGPEV